MEKKRVKLFNFRPAVISALSVIAGILSAFLYLKNGLISLIVPCVFLAVLLLCLFLIKDNKKAKIIYSILFSLLFILSGVHFSAKIKSFNDADLDGHFFSVDASVKEFYDTSYGQIITLENVNLKGKYSGKSEYNILLYVYGESHFDIGDNLSFFAVLKDLSLFYEGRFSADNVSRKTKYSATLNSDEITLNGNEKNLFQKANVKIRDTLKEGLSENEFSIAYAMLTGRDEFIDGDVLTSFREAGVAHIFAVSGLHIGFIAAVLAFIFRKTKCNKIISAILTVIIIFGYSGVCGFSASSIRAAIMSTVMLIALNSGLRYDALSSVGIAATVILLFMPVELFRVGFELSFVVVLSIILLSSPISKIFKFLPNKLASAIGVVISAFLAGIPICLSVFGSFSLFSVVSNLVFIPIVGVIFVLLILACLIGGIFSISYYVLFPLNYLLKAVSTVITLIDYRAFIIGGFTFGIFSVFYYIALILPSGLINLKRSVACVLTAVCIAVCVLGCIFTTVLEKDKIKCFVLGSDKLCVSVIDGDEYHLIVSDASNLFPLSRLQKLKDRRGVEKFSSVFITDDIDKQVFLTRLLTVFKVENVYLYGSENLTEKNIIEKSFKGITVYYLDDNESINVDGFDFSYKLCGKGITCDDRKNRILFLSAFGDYSSNYGGVNGINTVIATDNWEGIKNEYDNCEFLSYRYSEKYLNGESQGTYVFYLK